MGGWGRLCWEPVQLRGGRQEGLWALHGRPQTLLRSLLPGQVTGQVIGRLLWVLCTSFANRAEGWLSTLHSPQSTEGRLTGGGMLGCSGVSVGGHVGVGCSCDQEGDRREGCLLYTSDAADERT